MIMVTAMNVQLANAEPRQHKCRIGVGELSRLKVVLKRLLHIADGMIGACHLKRALGAHRLIRSAMKCVRR
jgi:hypothetical protein